MMENSGEKIELRHWTKPNDIACAFCKVSHAPFERRRSYSKNGIPIVVRLRMCAFCRYMKTIFQDEYYRKEIDLVLRMMHDNGIVSAIPERGKEH